jgi:hypothetical protein
MKFAIFFSGEERGGEKKLNNCFDRAKAGRQAWRDARERKEGCN